MSHDFVNMRIDDLGVQLWIIQQWQEKMREDMGLLYHRVFEYLEEGYTAAAEKQRALKRAAAAEKRAAASEGRAAAAEERAAVADKRAAAAEQATTKLDQSLDEIKGWLHTAYHAYHAIQTKASSIESRVSALEGGHKEHQGAQSSDRQLLQEQLQVLIDEQRKLHAELTQIQQQKKPTITSKTSKPVKHTSSCSSSSEQELAQKVMRSTSVS